MAEVFLFVGGSGSGKSTVARNLSNVLGAACLEERKIAHDIAAEQAFGRGRDWASSVGLEAAVISLRQRTAQLVAQASAGSSLVMLDGAYDSALPEAIQVEAPETAIRIVHLDAPREMRLERVARRMGAAVLPELAEAEMDFLDDLKRQAGMDQLIARADLHIVNDAGLAEVFPPLLELLGRSE